MPKRAKQDAIALLKADHKKLRQLLGDLAKTKEGAVSTRKKLLKDVAELVQAHTKIEEEFLYPAFHKAATKRKEEVLYYEAVEEHHAADMVLADLRAANPSGFAFAAKAKVLKELIEHHAQEEEEDMFPAARKILTKSELVDLGEDMAERRAELLNGKAASSKSRRSAPPVHAHN